MLRLARRARKGKPAFRKGIGARSTRALGAFLVRLAQNAGRGFGPARKYFNDSYNFNWQDNPEAKKYVEIVDSMLAERASIR
jgi:hypothetical protein